MTSPIETLQKIVHQIRYEDPSVAVFLNLFPNDIDRYLMAFSCALYRMGPESAWTLIEAVGKQVSELSEGLIKGE